MNNTDLIIAPHAALQLGDFEDAAWQRAPAVAIDHLNSGEAAPPACHCTARILWTNSALLARFDCRQDEPIFATPDPPLQAKTLDLFNRDVCEIFCAPPEVFAERYYEFEAAPNGEWLDLMLHRVPPGARLEPDWTWNSGMTTAARLEPKLTTIAMQIPWAALGRAPRAGEEWPANLFRCAGNPQRYLNWRISYSTSFHVPERFGRIRFED